MIPPTVSGTDAVLASQLAVRSRKCRHACADADAEMLKEKEELNSARFERSKNLSRTSHFRSKSCKQKHNFQRSKLPRPPRI